MDREYRIFVYFLNTWEVDMIWERLMDRFQMTEEDAGELCYILTGQGRTPRPRIRGFNLRDIASLGDEMAVITWTAEMYPESRFGVLGELLYKLATRRDLSVTDR